MVVVFQNTFFFLPGNIIIEKEKKKKNERKNFSLHLGMSLHSFFSFFTIFYNKRFSLHFTKHCRVFSFLLLLTPTLPHNTHTRTHYMMQPHIGHS
jgi:hypothetical protein